MKSKIKYIIFILLAGSLWGLTGIFTRELLPYGIDGIRLTFARSAFTLVVIFFIILFKDKSLLKIKLKDIWMFLGSGILSFLFFSFCYMNSISKNSLSAAAILLYTAPIFITVISIPLFKENLNIKKAVSLIAAITGCVLVACNGTITVTKIGLVYGIGSGLGYALYSIFGRIATEKYSSLTITFYTFLFATTGSAFFVNLKTLGGCFKSEKAIVLTLLCSVLTTILPYLFYTRGLTKISPSTASIIATIEPVVASVIGFLFFSEELNIFGVFGIIIVIGSIIFLNTPSFTLKKSK